MKKFADAHDKFAIDMYRELKTEHDKVRLAAEDLVAWAWTTSFNGNSPFGLRINALREALGLSLEDAEFLANEWEGKLRELKKDDEDRKKEDGYE